MCRLPQAADGKPLIEFPISLPLDNHSSRYAVEVLRACNDGANDLGFRMFFEDAGTSGFLQMWDQINRAAHHAYSGARKEYKKQYESK